MRFITDILKQSKAMYNIIWTCTEFRVERKSFSRFCTCVHVFDTGKLQPARIIRITRFDDASRENSGRRRGARVPCSKLRSENCEMLRKSAFPRVDRRDGRERTGVAMPQLFCSQSTPQFPNLWSIHRNRTRNFSSSNVDVIYSRLRNTYWFFKEPFRRMCSFRCTCVGEREALACVSFIISNSNSGGCKTSQK